MEWLIFLHFTAGLLAQSPSCRVSAMQISHELLRCTIDFCSAAFYLRAV
jgi:hypothetical protein